MRNRDGVGPNGQHRDLGPVDDLLARVSHLYFVLGLTQQAVADRLGLTRIKVYRLLAEARERGIVRISIVAPSARRLELEAGLADRFGLSVASLSPSDTTGAISLSQVIGLYAADAVQSLLRHDMTVAVAWGITLRALAENLAHRPLDNVDVVPLLGSLSRRSSVDRFEAATLLAQRVRGECYYMPGPIICGSAEARDTILQQPMTREILDKATRADLAFMSLGGTRSSTLRAMGYIDDAELAEIRTSGAIGNFNGYFLDADGQVLDHPINRRVVGLHPNLARRLPQRIMVSGGPAKVPVLRTLLERGWFTGLVTDEETGRALLA